ncbi:signal peptidase I [Carboxydochorda subterranea]|uniref:Signal peptidase I n=1 Tax=Carboxydichorda subterranea TaxID=3109565 RepID=A0ABZ1C0A7_9FIRM|nr:signal peptidase I [Limnochorda sp. L945t]WRP17782.1 signal peptidase I [Limnochorda sp. L945t]
MRSTPGRGGGPGSRRVPGPARPPLRRPTREAVWAAVVEFVKTLAGAAILAFLIMTFVARAFTVDGPSMLPSLHNGERLMVDKLTYRFREPQRGEIVVFRYPEDPREHFIKRIIGVPGDWIETGGGRVYVNGRALDEPYLDAPTLGRFGPVQVPPGHYFVMGDNRNNSEDSRDPRVGFVPRNLIEGRALWRFWPLTQMGVLRRPATFAALPPPPQPGAAQAAPALP